jgi:choline dehydrogenase-like flavoprotein
MPSIACQNPSLTFMALTARACDYAVKELKKEIFRLQNLE